MQKHQRGLLDNPCDVTVSFPVLNINLMKSFVILAEVTHLVAFLAFNAVKSKGQLCLFRMSREEVKYWEELDSMNRGVNLLGRITWLRTLDLWLAEYFLNGQRAQRSRRLSVELHEPP